MPKILIVDDVPTNLKILIEGLRNPDYEILVATSGIIALKIAKTEIPDLILLDVVMPEINGYDVCAQLKNDTQTRHIPIIFITTQNTSEDETKGLELGAVDYISKPFSLPTVHARVKTHLKLKQAYDELEIKNLALKENVVLREHVERITRHDLKSPLNGIIGSATFIMDDENLTAKQKKMLKLIEESGYKMLGMINRSLDRYKMEKGGYQYKPVPFNILPILHKVCSDLKNLSDLKKLSIVIPSNMTPFIIQGEQLLCYSMFANLLKNAFEASPPSETVTISLIAKQETAIISFHNKGVVPADIRDCFFEKYTTSGKSDGTGLGSYSARLMAETQGGSIHLDTSEDIGTTVTIRLSI
ncbi:MAG: hybrid sensor histidine kinase/response regulator [Thiomargarita sp.]|nr:hybrid sensor histidine kinase/response regulator [Thiomargarita sp.]